MYELSLIDLVDEDGITFSFYHFESLDESVDEWPWLQGIEFDSPPLEKLNLKIDLSDPDAGEFADCIGSYPPLMTARFKYVLDQCGVNNVKYFPVQIEGAERFQDFPEYFAFNVVGSVDVSSKMPPKIQIARKKGQLAWLIVSESVKNACKQAGIDTLRFNPI